MKKQLTIIMFSLLGMILFSECNKRDMKPEEKCPECKDYSNASFNGLSVRAAKIMTDAYMKNHYPKYGMTDASSVWFDLERMKTFIYKIEKAMCLCDSGKKLGLRVYFGEYPDPSTSGLPVELSSMSASAKGQHTVLFVPTYENNGVNYDFDPWHLGKGGCANPSTICDLLDHTDSGFSAGNMLALSESNMNHGVRCPPVCPGKCFSNIIKEKKEKDSVLIKLID